MNTFPPVKYVGVIALTLVLLALLYSSAFFYQLGALVSAEYWIHDAQIVKRDLLAQNREKQKLLFVAGSSAFFGIDSDRIERVLGISTINMGMSMNRPFDFMLKEIAPYIAPGDIVVLPLEYGYYSPGVPYTEWLTSQIMAWDPDYFRDLEPREKLEFMFSVVPQRVLLGAITKAMGERLESVRARRLKIPQEILSLVRDAWSQPDYHPEKIYSFLNIDPHGDARLRTPEAPRPFSKDPYELDVDFVESTYFWGNLRDFVLSCHARDIAVYIAWPPVVKNELDFTSPRVSNSIRQITGRLHDMRIPILGHPSDFQYDARWFTDHIYHLTPEGRAEHTTRLLSYLMAELHHASP